MDIGVPRETYPGERRVAVVPALLPPLIEAGHTFTLQQGAGKAAGYPDNSYVEAGAEVVADTLRLFERAEVLFMVMGPGANPHLEERDLAYFQSGQTLIAFLEPLSAIDSAMVLARRGLSAFAMELIPRITRAQSMDALSSMASLAGYKAVLLAADALPKIFPMMMTAAGALSPAKVFVIGAGVAGLQACATAKRLGAVVSAYDVRPVVKEQVESVGARFVEFDLESDGAEDSGGYAKAQSADFYERQQEAMAKVVGANDVVITTAAVPGKKAPVLITEAMIERMAPGSVVVDLAAERGGNCALTIPGQTVIKHDVTIIGRENLPSQVPYHASQMLARNITALFAHLTAPDGLLTLDLNDEITAQTLLCHGGELTHPFVREIAGLPPLEPPTPDPTE